MKELSIEANVPNLETESIYPLEQELFDGLFHFCSNDLNWDIEEFDLSVNFASEKSNLINKKLKENSLEIITKGKVDIQDIELIFNRIFESVTALNMLLLYFSNTVTPLIKEVTAKDSLSKEILFNASNEHEFNNIVEMFNGTGWDDSQTVETNIYEISTYETKEEDLDKPKYSFENLLIDHMEFDNDGYIVFHKDKNSAVLFANTINECSDYILEQDDMNKLKIIDSHTYLMLYLY